MTCAAVRACGCGATDLGRGDLPAITAFSVVSAANGALPSPRRLPGDANGFRVEGSHSWARWVDDDYAEEGYRGSLACDSQTVPDCGYVIGVNENAQVVGAARVGDRCFHLGDSAPQPHGLISCLRGVSVPSAASPPSPLVRVGSSFASWRSRSRLGLSWSTSR